MDKKNLLAAITASLAVGLAGAASASSNVLQSDKMDAAYSATQKSSFKLAGGKCGEGKCGGNKKKEGKCGEGKCGADKKKEGKCGEGKCGGNKMKEGKCGEGKCGANKS